MSATDTPAPCPAGCVALAARLADAARGIVGRYFRQEITVERKDDQSPVTVADREAEAAMRGLIAGAFPDHGIVGEEYGAERPDAEFVWILDPIDGTKRFIAGHTQFGTLIGLLHRGVPILGLIDMPMLDERWTGATGQPTVHAVRGTPRTVRARACPDLERAILFATTPHMFPGPDFAAFERVRVRAGQPMYGGECYAYGLLASGTVDLVIEATMGPHDYLPLVPVVTGAGGIITDWAGAPLGLDSDGRVIAAGDGRCHGAARELLAGG